MVLNGQKFWLEEPRELLSNFGEFIPMGDMTMEAKLNAIARFFIYFGALMVYYYGKKEYIMVAVFGIIFTVIIYNNHKKQSEEMAGGDYYKFEKFADNQGPQLEDTQLFNNKEASSRQVGLEEAANKCRLPSGSNPFMNPLTVEMNTPHLDGCNLSNPAVKEKAKEYFNNGLFRDVDDVFQRQNSERQFYTIPSTFNYQDQEIFSNWLYNTGNTCKQESGQCFRYEDIRHQFRN